MADQTDLEMLPEAESTGNPTKVSPDPDDPQTPISESLPEQPSAALESPDGGNKVYDAGDLKPETSSDLTNPWKLVLAQEVQELEKEKEFFNHDVVSRLARYSMATMTPIILLIILFNVTDNGRGTDDAHWISRLVGVSIALLFSFYFLSLFVQLYPGINQDEDAYLFKVRTRFSKVPDWAAMRIANTQLLHLYRPIQSISEFSAISGGLANQMLATLGPFTWVMITMLFAAEMQCDNDYQFVISAGDVLVLIGVAGIIMIGMFELNHYDRAMKLFHYVGVCMAIAILFAGMIQGVALSQIQNAWGFLVVPILLNAVAWPCFLYWQYISSESNAMQFEDEFKAHKEEHGAVDEQFVKDLKRRINRMSVQCITLEGVAIYSITLAFAWYIFNWGEYCARDCQGEWYCSAYCTFNYLGDD